MSNLGDGVTLAGTTVATGTNGVALSPVAVGNLIDVLFMAQSGVTRSCACTDSLGNVYTQIDHLDSTVAHTREFYRFQSLVTVGGTPVVTCVYGAASKIAVAAAILKNVLASNPFTSGQVANHYQTAASIGAAPTPDLQSSTNIPAAAVTPFVLTGWGYCDGQAAAPTPGTVFQGFVAPRWAALGTGACLMYETGIELSAAAISAKFTPVPSQDTYTFAAGFNASITAAVVNTYPQVVNAQVSVVNFALDPTSAGNALVLEVAIRSAGATITGLNVVGGGAWIQRSLVTGNGRTAAIYDNFNPTPGTTGVAVSVATPAGVPGFFGVLALQEVQGLKGPDQTGSTLYVASPVTVSCTRINNQDGDFVVAALASGNNSTNEAITDPPTGYISAGVNQNDNGVSSGSGEVCYRIDRAAVMDTAAWTVASGGTPGDPAVIASYLAGGVALAGDAADAVAASARLSSTLAAAAADVTSATAAIASSTALVAVAVNTTAAVAHLTNWATVVLTAPLYTGIGGLFDPNGTPWSNEAPPVGATVSYDPTFVTVATDAEIFSISPNCQFLAQWNNGGVPSFRIFILTSSVAGSAFDTTVATGLLSTVAILAAAATNLTVAVGVLSARVTLAAAAADGTVATGLLAVNQSLNSAALDVTAAAADVTVAAAVSGAAADVTVATGAISLQIAGAAVDGTAAVAALTARVALVGALADAVTALGALSARVILAVAALDSITAAGTITAHGALAGDAASADVAAGTVAAALQFVGSAGDTTAATGRVTIRLALVGAAITTTAATGLLRAHAALLVAAVNRTIATGNLSPHPQLQFGWASVVALSQTGMQGERATYLAGSACFVQVDYFDVNNKPLVPETVQYRVDDVLSEENIVPWTTLPVPGTTNQIVITSAQNAMVSLSRLRETHEVSVKITDGLGNVRLTGVAFDLISLAGAGNS